MSLENKVVWFEGMFLQPQHFQQHDRYMENLLQQKLAVISKHFWGFTELSLDLELLPIGKIGILSARGIFPDGTPFNIPRNDKSPTPFLIPEGMNNTKLFLAIPLRQSGTAEAGNETGQQPYRYHVQDFEVLDNVMGSSQSAQVQVGALACRILSEHDNRSGYSCLEITKVLESRTNQQITLDKGFLPTVLDVQTAPALSSLITEIHGLLHHRGVMLASRLTDTQQAGTAEIVDFMLLQLVNKYEPLFHYLGCKTPLHPEELYQMFLQLMGEMATFTNDKRRPIEPPVYRHEDLFNTFKPVIAELRHALSMVLEQNATAIKLEQRAHGVWTGQILDRELIKTCNFVLAVYADIPSENVRTRFPSQVKIAPVEQIRTLVSRALPGINLNPIAVAPRQIPYHANFSYFAVNTRHELWQQLVNSGGIAFHVGSEFPGLKLELWAIRG